MVFKLSVAHSKSRFSRLSAAHTRCPRGWSPSRHSRALTAFFGDGYDVLKPQIPRREVYALAYGMTPDIRGGDPVDLPAETYLTRAGLV